MSEGQVQRSSGGIGVLGLLGVLFVGLKLTGNIGWSWWWVSAPFWGGFALFLAACVVLLLASLVLRVLEARRRARVISGLR